MPKETIFISSVQKEFAAERQFLGAYIREDELLNWFFRAFACKEIPSLKEMGDIETGKSIFKILKTFTIIIWRPSAVIAHDTAHDTAHNQEFIHIENMPHRLLWIMKGEMSRSEIMVTLELTHRTNFKKNYLDPAIESGWIEMTIPETPRSKKQK